MQDQVLVQFNHYLRIAHHRHHHLIRLHFLVFYYKREEQEEQSHDVAPNVAPNIAPNIAPNVAPNTLTNIKIRMHSAFQFSAFHSQKIEVYISDKCIYKKNTKLSNYQNKQTTMAYYMRKFLDLSSWIMNPAPSTSTIAEANTISSQHFKTKKSTRILNIMMAERERLVPAPPDTQVQVTTPPAATQATIETQTIENPQLLAYTDEQLVGHYTHQLFQCEHAAASTSAASIPEDQTHTCSVCLETLNSGDKNTTLTPCGHAYHLSCLLTSLRNKNLCPMCRGSLEDPRPKPNTTNSLRPSNAEQIIRDELYWFPKSAHIMNIRGSNHPKRAFKDSLRTFAYAVLQTTAEFVHAGDVPEEWYSDDDTDDDEESGDENSENNENSENSENSENDENDENSENDENNENDENIEETENTEMEDVSQINHDQHDNHSHHYHIDEQHVNRTRGVNPFANADRRAQTSIRLRSSLRRDEFDLRDMLP